MSSANPKVAICIITYSRLPEITRTIAALQEHFIYSGEVLWHIADDGSPVNYVNDIARAFPSLAFSATITNRGGWGINANAALDYLKSNPYIFLIEDDYVANHDLNIDVGVALMQTNYKICAVRYDGLAGHELNLRLREQKTPIGTFSFMYIDKDSPHFNIYSNRPHLRHTARFNCFGKYQRFKSLGETEEIFAYRVKNSKKCMDIAVLADGVLPAFDHIGKSYQGGEKDKETVR